ncbi:YggS family pyridoxal phosphate-dependent enzyme [Catalinimonas niigatensis]|uniref:YggS family pyridoxal phosphate-dependent enzyme n=1 Tax=Catalinimonas niigatensis TaxID=1397264 RepID=UPI002666D751|nr:YggS family pyridoxal phosphate-dependent enzyme [Catalinimonas niigatensis]WPP53134.1 YggS family pyridoxal phosphate-dependent enzyme [Catalinimonas niigatensis]
MSVAKNLEKLQRSIASYPCLLVAVSKTKPVEVLMEAYEAGVRDFGENKVQEMVDKHEQMPKDCKWHMIGHLQRNKVKYIIPFVHLIHAVDSARLLKEIEKQAEKEDRIVDCLLQIHIAEEQSKFGLSEEELFEILYSEMLAKAKYVQIKGLMGMATFTEDKQQVRREFKHLRQIFDKAKVDAHLPKNVNMQKLSIGMSGDYQIALEEGSTILRIGTTIFGSRN